MKNSRTCEAACTRTRGAVLLGVAFLLTLIAAPVSATTLYWNLFNIEGVNSPSARYQTYLTLDDMLNDTNRIVGRSPNSGGFGQNVVGSGSDGTNYWNLFNIEGENSITAQYVTYLTFDDMLRDTNRIDIKSPNSQQIGKNVVGSGAFFLADDPVPAIPLPAALPLYGTGLAVMGFLGWRRKRQALRN